MFPRFQFKVGDRIIVDYGEFVSKVEGTTLSFKLEEADVVPSSVDAELVSLGGVKLNVVSLIDSKTSSEFVVQGWKSLEKVVPLREMMVPFLYSTVIDYVRFGITTGVEPHWTKLLRLCFWYQKCLEMNDSNFHFKQTELKRKILKPLRNAQKALAQGPAFLPATQQLATTIMSYTSELKFPSLANASISSAEQHLLAFVGVMAVHESFLHYISGVYHSLGDQDPIVGYHCIGKIGYSDAKNAEKIRNSWSTQWGEDGYCWIQYGDSEIDSIAYSVEPSLDRPSDNPTPSPCKYGNASAKIANFFLWAFHRKGRFYYLNPGKAAVSEDELWKLKD